MQASPRILLVGLAAAGLLAAGPVAGRESPSEPVAPVAEVLLQSGQSWNGAELPAYPDGPAEISIVRFTIPPGTALPVHRHPVINGGLVLSGELIVRLESGEEIRLQAGDPLLEVVNTWHAGRNEGEVPAVAVVFYVGTPGTSITEVQEPPPDSR